MSSDRFDLERIQAELPDVRLDWRAELRSTNDHALAAARQGDPTPLLVLADQQTAGRGRGENRWWSNDGSLTFSLLIHQQDLGLDVEHWPLASMAVGLAICQAVESLAAGAPVCVKWPNDVFLDERKLAGVLVETNATPRCIVLGIGVNVNTELAAAPADIRSRSVSLRDHFDRPFDLTHVLCRIVREVFSRTKQLSLSREAVLAQWRERCLLSGREIEVEVQQRRIGGICRGVDEEGALVIAEGKTMHRIFAGVVSRFSAP